MAKKKGGPTMVGGGGGRRPFAPTTDAANTGVKVSSTILSELQTKLSKGNLSGKGATSGAGGPVQGARKVKGRSDSRMGTIANADAKKKKSGLAAEAEKIGSSGKALGA